MNNNQQAAKNHTEIRDIEYNLVQPFPWRTKTQVIHHVALPDAVIQVAGAAANGQA